MAVLLYVSDLLRLRGIRFNQATISYDASKEEKVDALKAKHAQTADRLREK